MANLSKRSLDNLIGVEPSLVQLVKTAIVDTPFDFTVTEGVRTTKRQQELFAQRPKVTNADSIKNKSNHQVKADGFGHAIDLYPYYNGAVQVQDKDVIPRLKKIADHFKEKAKCMNIKITWGGDWKNPYDPPHFQIEK